MEVRGVTPTRAELLSVMRKIRLAERGHRILKMKREVLILELVRLARLAKGLRTTIGATHRQARHTLAIAEMMEGSFGVMVASVSVEEVPEFRSGRRSVMGLRLPVYEAASVKKSLTDRGYGLLGTSSVIDEAAESYEELVTLLVQLAEYEISIRLILGEIGKTTRRVNALEKKLIPDLRGKRDWIVMQRDELERGEFSRRFFSRKARAVREEDASSRSVPVLLPGFRKE